MIHLECTRVPASTWNKHITSITTIDVSVLTETLPSPAPRWGRPGRTGRFFGAPRARGRPVCGELRRSNLGIVMKYRLSDELTHERRLFSWVFASRRPHRRGDSAGQIVDDVSPSGSKTKCARILPEARPICYCDRFARYCCWRCRRCRRCCCSSASRRPPAPKLTRRRSKRQCYLPRR